MLRGWWVYLPAVLCGCAVSGPETVGGLASQNIDVVLDLQPFVVDADWDLAALEKQTVQLNAAFAQAGVSFRILAPTYVSHPAWEDIEDEAELGEMMGSAGSGIRVWLVRGLGPNCICPTDGSEAPVEYGGVAYPPTHPCHGVALGVKATRDHNTLVHEMGHAFGLDHPVEGASACENPEAACRFMSYCYRTRNQFSAHEIDTIRSWAVVLSGD